MISSSVTVTTEAPLIETERTQQANTIERRQVEGLPNVGRDFTAYVYTLPGDVVVSGILQNLPGAAILADYPALNSVVAPSASSSSIGFATSSPQAS